MDARGNAYANRADADFADGAPPKPGYIKLVTPDGWTLIISEWLAAGSPRS